MNKHGQKLDRQIAKDTGITLPQVRLAITKLQSTKAVFSCNVINFESGIAVARYLMQIIWLFSTCISWQKACGAGSRDHH
jgi:hypothetical protein